MDRKSSSTCPICGKEFSIRSNTKRHLEEVHSTHPQLQEILNTFIRFAELCPKCSRYFFSLEKHVRTCRIRKVYFVSCWLCDDKPPMKKRKIIQHYAECHNIDMSVEKLNFNSLEDFGKWKREMEIDTTTRYITDNHVTNSKYSVHYFKCHRDGIFKSRGKNVRQIKHHKINGHCPAKIRVCESLETGLVEVEFLGTHVGHDNNLDMIPKRSANRHLFYSPNREHDYCKEETEEVKKIIIKSEEEGEETIKHEETDSNDDFCEGIFKEFSETGSIKKEVKIAEIKDRILVMMYHYLETSTTRDQFEVIENAVFSIGPVLDALDGKESEAPSLKRQKMWQDTGMKLCEER